MTDIIVVTTPIIPGYRIKEIKGIVSGLAPRTRGLGGKILAGFQSIVGGEISVFTSELEKARKLGANAVIGVDIETSEVFEGVVVISATGTAVVVEKEE